MFQRIVIAVAILLAASLVAQPAHAREMCPDLSEIGPSIATIEGQFAYSNINLAVVVDEPVLFLIDESNNLRRQSEYAPSNGQIAGRLTSDFFTSPVSFTVDLPITPRALTADLDQDAGDDVGVQVFSVVLGQNVFNAPYLEGFTQEGIAQSYLKDSTTEAIREGALLLYAPDGEQGFPCAAGDDGIFFTADDLIATLPPGYTVARIADGAVTFERAATVVMDILEDQGTATPDLTDQGIVESFDTLIEFLKERYVFNEINGVDWDALSAQFRPQVEAAEAAQNLGLYFAAVFRMAQALRDAHVAVSPGNVLATQEGLAAVLQVLGPSFGSIAAKPVELDDGRVILGEIAPDGPAAQAGLAFGTEILAVNSIAVADAIDNAPYDTFPGAEESQRLAQVGAILNALPGSPIEVTYLLSGASEPATVVMTTTQRTASKPDNPMPMRYDLVDGFGYVTWPSFSRTGIANHIFEDFIKVMHQDETPGIILDLRGNGGGSLLLMYSVLSYLYGAENPLTFDGIIDFGYDTSSGEFVNRPAEENTISTATEAPAYEGAVVVLVDEECVSACEFTSFYLQHSERAVIIGQYGTNGAGGSVQSVILPGDMQFNYTAGTSIFADSGKPIFQGIGVLPDIRVPVTEETERQKLEGGDPVLDAALEYIREATAAEAEVTSATAASAPMHLPAHSDSR